MAGLIRRISGGQSLLMVESSGVSGEGRGFRSLPGGDGPCGRPDSPVANPLDGAPWLTLAPAPCSQSAEDYAVSRFASLRDSDILKKGGVYVFSSGFSQAVMANRLRWIRCARPRRGSTSRVADGSAQLLCLPWREGRASSRPFPGPFPSPWAWRSFAQVSGLIETWRGGSGSSGAARRSRSCGNS